LIAPVVVKLGGSLLEDPARRAGALDAIASQAMPGAAPFVVVHGGGRHVDAWLSRLGIPRQVHQGIRVTDAATLDAVMAVLPGLVNTMLVAELASRGVRAFGLSGVDGGLLPALPMEPDGPVDFGHVGRVGGADPAPLRALLQGGYVPVVASLAAGPGAVSVAARALPACPTTICRRAC
jgi:acetylglutamate kinase